MNNPVGIYFAFWEKEWDADYAYYIDKVKRLGFDVLEIAAASLTEMSPQQRRSLAAAAREAGIALTYCIGLPSRYDVASADEQVRRDGIAYVGGLLDAIGEMGGGTLGGILYSCWPLGLAADMEYKKRARELALQSVRELAGRAEDRGVDLCMEIVNRFEQCLLNTAEEGVAFVQEVDSPRVKLLLDTFHMNIEEDFIGDAIRRAAGRLGHFHIGECNRNTPGHGHMPWDEIMGALKDIGYEGAIVMEPFIRPGGQVGKDIKVFRDLSGGADEAAMDALAAEALAFIRRKEDEA